eukprot:2906925-Lingulodinium_polyedra.AAC.1
MQPHRCAAFHTHCATMRSHQSSAAAAVGVSHARALHARARQLARAWAARACDSRAAEAADGRSDRTVAQRFTNVAH